MGCSSPRMSTKPSTYIVCDHCGSLQSLTGEQAQGVDADGRSHRAMDLPCSNCGRPGATSATGSEGGPDSLRQITERENGLAG
jgi:hypothetical protein